MAARAARALVLGAAVMYAASADGAVLGPDETRLQVWLPLVAVATLAALSRSERWSFS